VPYHQITAHPANFAVGRFVLARSHKHTHYYHQVQSNPEEHAVITTKNKGFTLIELMVTVAIVTILATIAIPAYTQYVQRGKIAEATSTLASLRVQMEQFFQDNRTYVGGPCAPGAGSTRYFAYACAAGEPTATTYNIVATGVAGQGMAGFSYTIDQANTKTSLLPDGSAGATCWITKSGEAC
jgi:type IV pilus assembly protein PilE